MKELIEALHVIQDECKKHRMLHCYECPFWSDNLDACKVIDSEPMLWEINDKAEKALL